MSEQDTRESSRSYADALDTRDELAAFRDRFVVADSDLLYLDGNSLGRLSHDAANRIDEVVHTEWGVALIRGWNEGWYEAPLRVGDKIGSLLGAAPGQVAVSDSTSVNLFKTVVAALQLRPKRKKIVTDTLNFPTDLYILQGATEIFDRRWQIVRIGSPDKGITPDLAELWRAVDDQTALVVLSHVSYKSAFLYDMEEVTRNAHARGALVLWDLSHSAGVIPMELDAWGVDFAVGCTYKYLNGGPGAPAFLYVRRELQEETLSPIWGWFGREAPFTFGLDYAPAAGISRFLAGTPPVLSLLAMEAALETTATAGVQALRRKSVEQTDYLIALADVVLSPLGFSVASPRENARRGSHVALRHEDGFRIAQGLIQEMKVIPDFREPDILRFGCVPLYTRYSEIWDAVDRTRRVVSERRFEKYPRERRGVT